MYNNNKTRKYQQKHLMLKLQKKKEIAKNENGDRKVDRYRNQWVLFHDLVSLSLSLSLSLSPFSLSFKLADITLPP